jgi:hypothetical protein
MGRALFYLQVFSVTWISRQRIRHAAAKGVAIEYLQMYILQQVVAYNANRGPIAD